MSNSSGAGQSTPVLPFLLLAAVAAGGFYLYEKPFESTRPAAEELDTSFAVDTESVRARLWEDPFTAVAEALNASKPASAGDDDRPGSLANQIVKTLERNDVTVVPVMVQHGWYGEDIEQRRRRRYAVLSALGAAGYQPRHSERVSYFNLPETQEFPLVVSGPEGIVPYEWFNPDRTSFDRDLSLEEQPRVLVMWVADGIFDRPLLGLANLLSGLSGAVHESTSEASPNSMHFKIVGPSSSQVLQRMMWEASREATDDICKQFTVLSQEPVEMYSPTATAEEDILLGASLDAINQASERPASQPGESIEECGPPEDSQIEQPQSIAAYFDRVHISFFRTNAGDAQLAKAILIDEFPRRRIFAHDPRHVVVLLSEWDTFYGRALPESFAKILLERRKLFKESPRYLGVDNICASGVCLYSYLRGLDGETPQAKPQGTSAGTSGGAKAAAPPDPTLLERASGEAQYDYLRRLAQEIATDVGDAGLDVKAVGVLGTDVYDKLLVLQALHDRFPRALFFTTDLDARYMHASAYPFTRNLVVASGFGLESELKGNIETPPFRDNYQAATFFAIQLALDRTGVLRKKLNECCDPLLFEVGQDKAYELSTDIDGHTPWLNALIAAVSKQAGDLWNMFRQPLDDINALAGYENSRYLGEQETLEEESSLAKAGLADTARFASFDPSLANGPRRSDDHEPDQSTPIEGALKRAIDSARWNLRMAVGAHGFLLVWTILALLLIAFALFSLMRIARLKPVVNATASGVLILVPPLTLLGIAWLIAAEEPFALSRGVSVWPAEAIRLLACTLSIALLINSYRSLARNATKLDGRYLLWCRRETDVNDRALLTRREDSKRDQHLTNQYWVMERRRTAHTDIASAAQRARSQYLVETSAEHKPLVDVRALWRSYVDAYSNTATGSAAPRTAFWRLAASAIFFAVPVVLIALLSSSLPVRGDTAYYTDKIILALAISAFIMLLLYVLYATLDCRRFIFLLVRRVSDYPSRTLRKFADAHRMSETERMSDLADWLDVHLIANRTRAVATLIYWPFLILLLLWISYSQIFDGWHHPLVHYVLLLTPALLVLGSQIALRSEAEKGRRRALDRMDHKLSGAHGANDAKRVEQLKLLIEEIQGIQEGAFRPISQQPILKALLLPFAGAGGVLALEYLVAN